MDFIGEVAERSIAADCKSAALVATEVRTLPSPPLDSAASRARSWQARQAGESSGAVSERSESNGFCVCLADALRASAIGDWAATSGRRVQRACLAVAARTHRASRGGGSNSVVESQPSKLLVAGSIPVSRSNLRSRLQTSARAGGWIGKPDFARQAVAFGRADLSAEARLVYQSAECEGGRAKADVAQLAERVLGKDEVTSSILVIGSTRLGRFAASLAASRRAAESSALTLRRGSGSLRAKSRGERASRRARQQNVNVR
jgi:hypothetical protein